MNKMNKTKCIAGSYLNEELAVIENEADLGVDSKGRKIGGYATITRENATMHSGYEGDPCTDSYQPTIAYGPPVLRIRVYSTRDGSDFGAIPRSTELPDGELEQAQILARKKLAEQAKRRTAKVAK